MVKEGMTGMMIKKKNPTLTVITPTIGPGCRRHGKAPHGLHRQVPHGLQRQAPPPCSTAAMHPTPTASHTTAVSDPSSHFGSSMGSLTQTILRRSEPRTMCCRQEGSGSRSNGQDPASKKANGSGPIAVMMKSKNRHSNSVDESSITSPTTLSRVAKSLIYCQTRTFDFVPKADFKAH